MRRGSRIEHEFRQQKQMEMNAKAYWAWQGPCGDCGEAAVCFVDHEACCARCAERRVGS